MKKQLIITTMLLLIATHVIAQNANRSGIFVEAGIGALVGNPPVSKLEWKKNTLTAYYQGGPDVNLAIGYRHATSKAFALEIKAEASVDPASPNSTFVIAGMPGFRYTTKEIFGNVSLYFGLNVGIALARILAMYDYDDLYRYYDGYYGGIELNYGRELDSDFQETPSAKVSFNAGFNFTQAFYGGLYCDFNYGEQVTEITFSDSDFALKGWGSFGARFGYRF